MDVGAKDLLPPVIFGPALLLAGILLFRHGQQFQGFGLGFLSGRREEIGEVHAALVRLAAVLFIAVGGFMVIAGVLVGAVLTYRVII